MTVTAQQDSLWLQISVHNVHIVQVLQSQGNLYKSKYEDTVFRSNLQNYTSQMYTRTQSSGSLRNFLISVKKSPP
jgi:hypothetical protein